jgi:hypothetical protein
VPSLGSPIVSRLRTTRTRSNVVAGFVQVRSTRSSPGVVVSCVTGSISGSGPLSGRPKLTVKSSATRMGGVW